MGLSQEEFNKLMHKYEDENGIELPDENMLENPDAAADAADANAPKGAGEGDEEIAYQQFVKFMDRYLKEKDGKETAKAAEEHNADMNDGAEEIPTATEFSAFSKLPIGSTLKIQGRNYKKTGSRNYELLDGGYSQGAGGTSAPASKDKFKDEVFEKCRQFGMSREEFDRTYQDN